MAPKFPATDLMKVLEGSSLDREVIEFLRFKLHYLAKEWREVHRYEENPSRRSVVDIMRTSERMQYIVDDAGYIGKTDLTTVIRIENRIGDRAARTMVERAVENGQIIATIRPNGRVMYRLPHED